MDVLKSAKTHTILNLCKQRRRIAASDLLSPRFADQQKSWQQQQGSRFPLNHLRYDFFFCTVSIVLTVLSESTVVCGRFHLFQLQLCCTLTNKAAAAVLAGGSSLRVMKTQRQGLSEGVRKGFETKGGLV